MSMAFLECACKQISKLNNDEKVTFWSLAKELISAPAVHQYNKVIDALKIICQRNDTMTWLQWLEKRRCHIIPAFRGFNISGLNLAKTGHSSMKTKNTIEAL